MVDLLPLALAFACGAAVGTLVAWAARGSAAQEMKALSAGALHDNSRTFLELARAALAAERERASGDLERREHAVAAVVAPVRDALDKLEGKVHDLEVARAGAYQGVLAQVESLRRSEDLLRAETASLVKALRAPHVRGRWGEMQLRRVVELADMTRHCDFTEQPTVNAEEGRLRPDLVVHVPGGREIVVDAKAPLEAYLEAAAAPDEETRRAKLKDHARQLRDRIGDLAGKAYFERFASPEVVVMFLPGEPFLAAALEADPALLEHAFGKGVVLATPMTLMSILKGAAYGWWQHALGENAARVSELGAELHGRLVTMVEHLGKTGDSLARAVGSYNQAVASLEARVLVSARRLKDLGVASGAREIPVLAPVEAQARSPDAERAERAGAA